jgi:chlorobactene glucosyltransferase
MTSLAIALTILAGLVGLVWGTRHLKIRRELRGQFTLTEDYAGPPEPPQRLSILVAAKDEQRSIEACIRSLLQQDYPDIEIIACNDRSTDATAEILDRLAEEDSRVKVVHITNLPDGWKGKNHALAEGVRQASGELLFFTDADCRMTSPRTLSVAVQLLADRGAGLLSMLPTLEMQGFWENAIQPVCAGVMMIWFNPNRVNDPNEPDSYANGAFLLFRLDVYQAVGGHAGLRDEMQEDLLFARKVKTAGLGLTVPRSRGLYVVRMYTTLREIMNGWTRIFLGSFVTLRRLIASAVLMLVMAAGPYVSLAAGVAGLLLHGEFLEPYLWAIGVGLAASALQASVLVRFYGLTGANRRYIWAYLPASLVVLGILLRSMGKLRRGATLTWKGTAYPRRVEPRM